MQIKVFNSENLLIRGFLFGRLKYFLDLTEILTPNLSLLSIESFKMFHMLGVIKSEYSDRDQLWSRVSVLDLNLSEQDSSTQS